LVTVPLTNFGFLVTGSEFLVEEERWQA
jgi:hypothetical protein